MTQDADLGRGVCPTCGLTMSMFHPNHAAEKVRVVADVLEDQISFAHQGSAERLARRILAALQHSDGSDG